MEYPRRPRKSPKFEAARTARIAAVQALYQMAHQNLSIQDVTEEFLTYRFQSSDYPYQPNKDLFLALTGAAQERLEDVDHMIRECLSAEWTLERLDSVLKAILRAACLELLAKVTPLPAPVLISEYVDITKGFFEGHEPGFVNGILDRISRALGYALNAENPEF